MNVPGMVIGTSKQGMRLISTNGFRSSLEVYPALKMLPDTSFDIASLTKIVATTNSIMSLVTNKELNLDDVVSKYLPAWNTSEKSEITIRHLLQHRSGLWEWKPLYISATSPESSHALIASSPLRCDINTERRYSDLGFIALGAVITKITGKPLSESVHELSLDKLHLNSTQFAQPTDMSNVAATSRGDRFEKQALETNLPYPVTENVEDFSHWRSKVLSGEVGDGNAFHAFGGVSSHAGIFSNANDLLTYGESLLASAEFNHFTQEGIDPNFHLGFRSWIDTYDKCSVRFYGHTGFTGVLLAVSPHHESVFVGLSNRLHTDGEIVATEEIFLPQLHEFHLQIH